MRERSEIVVSTIVETCEARAGLFKSQKGSRKQFSPLWRFYEVRASLLKFQESSRKQFSPLWGFCEAAAGLFKCVKGPR